VPFSALWDVSYRVGLQRIVLDLEMLVQQFLHRFITFDTIPPYGIY